MSKAQLDDLFCYCDNKEGIGELDLNTGVYLCLRCYNKKMKGGFS